MRLYIFLNLIPNVLCNIVFTISSTIFDYQCVNNNLSIFGLNMFIKGNVNDVQFDLPMSEIGLPDINMDWFVDGKNINQVIILNPFNIDNSQTLKNRWSFTLKDDQPNIGAGIIQLGPCNSDTTYFITSNFICNSFIVGMGVPSIGILPESGIPLIINNLDPSNIQYTVKPTTSTQPTTTSTQPTTTSTQPTTTSTQTSTTTSTQTSTTTLTTTSTTTLTTTLTTIIPSYTSTDTIPIISSSTSSINILKKIQIFLFLFDIYLIYIII